MPRGKRKNENEENDEEKAQLSESNTSSSNGRLKEKLQVILQEYDVEVGIRCQEMEGHAKQLTLGLQNALQIELLKLPKNLRSMTMRQFMKEYHGDWSALGRPARLNTSVAPTPAREPAKITLKLAGGTALELDESTVSSLDSRTKEEAKARLVALQNELNSIMSAFR